MSDQLQGRRIAILVANEGVEQVELTSPVGALREAGAELHLLAPEEGKIQAFNHLDKGDTFTADKTVGKADRAEEIAARAVNKEKARSGESKSSSRSSTRGRSASSRGG